MHTIKLKSIKEVGRLLNCRNQILIKRKYKNDEHWTPSGIYIIADSTFRPALHADRIGEVIMVPDELFYHTHTYARYPYGGESMPWDCEMELEVGDIVVHTFMERHDIMNIEVEDEPGELYRMMPYDDIYVARRGDQIIPLNGYCLCEEVEKEKPSSIIETIEFNLAMEQQIGENIDHKIGKVAYVAKPNRAYRNNSTGIERDLDGNAEVNIGDTIIKRRGDIHIRLEEDIHKRFFDNPVLYFIIQRKDIMGVRT